MIRTGNAAEVSPPRPRFPPLALALIADPSRDEPDEASPRAGAEHRDRTPERVWERELPDSPRSVKALRLLGVEPSTGASTIRQRLSPSRFVPLRAACYEDQSKVMWLDPELSSLFGFPDARGERLGPSLERSLLAALAFQLPEPNEDISGRRRTTLYADRYGGNGLGENDGAGRAAFHPWLNVYAKGIGKTPLHHDSSNRYFDDRVHEHGLLTVREAAIEAIWGSVGRNLFTHGAARTLAIIELGRFVRWGEDDLERACLLLRTSVHARPAHMIDRHNRAVAGGRAFFASAAADLGLMPPDGEIDLRDAFGKIIDLHAETSAEQYRFRVLHGAISPSNMLLSGEQLDVATMTAQLRTAPIRVLDDAAPFGREHEDRARELRTVYEALLGSPPNRRRDRNRGLGLYRAMTRQYRHHLEIQFLRASGMKSGLAARLSASEPSLTKDYGETLLALGQLSYDGEDAPKSAVDVFGLLGCAPKMTPRGAVLPLDEVLRGLEPDLGGAHDQPRAVLVDRIRANAARFSELYPQVVAAAESHAGDFYDDLDSMHRSLAHRAAFENRPLELLTTSRLAHTVDQAARQYDPFRPETRDHFWREVDDVAVRSMRSIEGLLRQGRSRRIDSETVEIEARTSVGLGYAIRASTDGARELRVTLPLEGDDDGYELPGCAGPLTRDELSSVVYQYTLDDWHEVSERGAPLRVSGRLEDDARGLPCLVFSAPVEAGTAAHLEGVFEVGARGAWLKDREANFRGYAFAVPDGRDLQEILAATPQK